MLTTVRRLLFRREALEVIYYRRRRSEEDVVIRLRLIGFWRNDFIEWTLAYVFSIELIAQDIMSACSVGG